MKRKLVRTRAIRSRVKYFERGKVSPRFDRLANELLRRRKKAYRTLAKMTTARTRDDL